MVVVAAATGPRLLVKPGAQANTVQTALATGLVALCGELEASSVHVTFCAPDEQDVLVREGFLRRIAGRCGGSSSAAGRRRSR